MPLVCFHCWRGSGHVCMLSGSLTVSVCPSRPPSPAAACIPARGFAEVRGAMRVNAGLWAGGWGGRVHPKINTASEPRALGLAPPAPPLGIGSVGITQDSWVLSPALGGEWGPGEPGCWEPGLLGSLPNSGKGALSPSHHLLPEPRSCPAARRRCARQRDPVPCQGGQTNPRGALSPSQRDAVLAQFPAPSPAQHQTSQRPGTGNDPAKSSAWPGGWKVPVAPWPLSLVLCAWLLGRNALGVTVPGGRSPSRPPLWLTEQRQLTPAEQPVQAAHVNAWLGNGVQWLERVGVGARTPGFSPWLWEGSGGWWVRAGGAGSQDSWVLSPALGGEGGWWVRTGGLGARTPGFSPQPWEESGRVAV
ncbi:unnamed protein product [Caretta caretta]